MAASTALDRPSTRIPAMAGIYAAAALLATGCASGSGSALAIGPQVRAAQERPPPEGPPSEAAGTGVLAVSGNVVLPAYQLGGLVSGNLSFTTAMGNLALGAETSLGTPVGTASAGVSATGLTTGPSPLIQPSLGGALGPVGPGALTTPSPAVNAGSSSLVTGAVQTVRTVSCPALPAC